MTRIEIDPNVRSPWVKGNTYTGFENADGPVAEGDNVTVFESEDDMVGEAVVTKLVPDYGLIYLCVDWTTWRSADDT